MGYTHYRVEAAWDRKFLGHIDADRSNPAEILNVLHGRKLLPPGFGPKDLEAVVIDDEQVRIEGSQGVCLFLTYSPLGSEQIVDEDEPKEPTMTDFPRTNTGKQLFHILNLCRALGTKDEKPSDRKDLIRNLEDFADKVRDGSNISEADLVIRAHTKCVVQA